MTDPLLRPYLERPILGPHLAGVWQIFARLSRRRPVGMGIGAIPTVEFEAYCRTFGIDSVAEREWLFVRLDALDAAYLAYQAEQAKVKADKKDE